MVTLALLALLTADADPPAIQKIRARYNAVQKDTGDDAAHHSVTARWTLPGSGAQSYSLSVFYEDRTPAELAHKQRSPVVATRIVKSWNFSVQSFTEDHTYDAAGKQLVFAHHTSGAYDCSGAGEHRAYFEDGKLIRMMFSPREDCETPPATKRDSGFTKEELALAAQMQASAKRRLAWLERLEALPKE